MRLVHGRSSFLVARRARTFPVTSISPGKRLTTESKPFRTAPAWRIVLREDSRLLRGPRSARPRQHRSIFRNGSSRHRRVSPLQRLHTAGTAASPAAALRSLIRWSHTDGRSFRRVARFAPAQSRTLRSYYPSFGRSRCRRSLRPMRSIASHKRAKFRG